MEAQSVLILILCVLVITLAVLLITRIVREQRQTAAIRRMSLPEFSDFLRTNSLTGSIQDVARKVSDLLTKSFGCEVIVFLRKKRHVLELNYFYGIRRFNRRDFRVNFSRTLGELLQEDFLPRSTVRLKSLLPRPFCELLAAHKLDVFFPIYWRDNLYGLYFVRSTIETHSPAFNLLVASLAQALSAAYHIKWHETRLSTVQKQLEDTRASSAKEMKTHTRLQTSILKLIRHREAETLVPRLVAAIRQNLGMNRVAYLYRDRRSGTRPTLFQEGVSSELIAPDNHVFGLLLETLANGGPVTLSELARGNAGLKPWTEAMTRGGLRYAAVFPLSDDRAGVLTWSTREDAATVTRQLHAIRPQVAHLIDNAEAYRQLEEMSFTDNLTGLANRRYFSRRLEEEIARAKRYSRHLAMIFFDMDDLKTINDRYGHLAGDSVLRQVGQILKESVRGIDIVARYGGDEFCIIMPEADATTCLRFMDRLKVEVAGWAFALDGVADPITCTISQGGAVFPEHADTVEGLVRAADMALLKAKAAGRNASLLCSADR